MATTAKKKKIDYKATAKNTVKDEIKAMFGAYHGIIDCAEQPLEGFTRDTIIIKNVEVEGVEGGIDVQVKLITPGKADMNHYDVEPVVEKEGESA